jgi:hypothetical protein
MQEEGTVGQEQKDDAKEGEGCVCVGSGTETFPFGALVACEQPMLRSGVAVIYFLSWGVYRWRSVGPTHSPADSHPPICAQMHKLTRTQTTKHNRFTVNNMVDCRIRECFGDLVQLAVDGKLNHWATSDRGNHVACLRLGTFPSTSSRVVT